MKGKQPTTTVLAMGQLHFEGNIIPHTWYQHLTKIVRRKCTKAETHEVETPYIEAIVILSDICYWYRPQYIKDEKTNQLVALERRFGAEKLQRSYQQLADSFGFGKDQVRRAVKYLEDKGLITLDFKTVSMRGVPLSNVMFVEPVPDAIAKINLPIDTLSDVHSTSPSMDIGEDPGCTAETYTEISPETSPEISQKEAADAERLANSPLFHGDGDQHEPERHNPAQERLARMRAKFGDHPVQLGRVTEQARQEQTLRTVPEDIPKSNGKSPAVLEFKRATGYMPPTPWRDSITDYVGAEPADLQRWYDTCYAWVGCGWNPRNAKGMLDYYILNEVPGTKGVSPTANNGEQGMSADMVSR